MLPSKPDIAGRTNKINAYCYSLKAPQIKRFTFHWLLLGGFTNRVVAFTSLIMFPNSRGLFLVDAKYKTANCILITFVCICFKVVFSLFL